MTRDDILRMAREAGFEQVMRHKDGSSTVLPTAMFERFAAMVAVEEREARQEAQHQVAELQERLNRADAERCSAVIAAREECAAAIESAACAEREELLKQQQARITELEVIVELKVQKGRKTALQEAFEEGARWGYVLGRANSHKVLNHSSEESR